MRGADAFEDTAFLGLARSGKRDPYRLSLFGEHLEEDERPLAFLPIHGGTLLVTDQRLLELRAHLEVHGAWNVKQFQGYALHQAVSRGIVREMTHEVVPVVDAVGNRRSEDRLRLTTDGGPLDFLVSKGPGPTLSEEDLHVLRATILGPQAK